MVLSDRTASVNGTPKRAAARARASSPSNQQTPAAPVGPTARGMLNGLPKIVASVLRLVTSIQTLLRSLTV